jgi:glycosyltransferase involved in cell wall biosynthesis
MAERFSVGAMVAATQGLYDELVAAAATGEGAAPRNGSPTEPGTVALVASQFPRNVDAYFLREVAGLAARGIPLRIFSLRAFEGKVIHGAAKPLMARTVYVPFLASWALWRANALALARTPGRYLGTLGRLVGGLWRRPRSLVLSLAVFPKSVYFAEIVRKERIGHIHANWASHPAASAFVMARLTGATWSFAGHASDIYLDAGMLRDKIREARFVLTCTKHNKEYLVGVGGRDTADKITVSYHGVDLQRFRPLPSRAPGPFRILTVGTLRECKGLPDLIEACRMLADRGVSFECAIVGDGEERQDLERLIRSRGLEDRIRITGFLAQEELIPLYQEAGVVTLPALSESHFGIPNILLEALAVGTPVICTPLPSLSEFMVDGVHGIFVPEQSPKMLADAIEALARDPERCRAIGAAGRLEIEALFDTEKNVAALDPLFRSATNLHETARRVSAVSK